MSDETTETAVVAQEPASPPTTAIKRRLSDEPDLESKRQRLSPDKQSPEHGEKEDVAKNDRDNTIAEQSAEVAANAKTIDESIDAKATATQDARRKGGPVDEKQRSKRLFGSLLGTLGQGADRTSKRRQEIESRRKAELQRQDDERDETRQRRVEQIVARRKKEKWRVEEEDMRIRHLHSLDAANFLRTTSTPSIYYLPWELLPDDEARVEAQIQSTNEQIDREVAELEDKKRVYDNVTVQEPQATIADDTKDPDDIEPVEQGSGTSNGETTEAIGHTEIVESQGQDKSTHDTDTPKSDGLLDPNVSETTKDSTSKKHEEDGTSPQTGKNTLDHDDEHMLEGEEDTVIY